MIILTFLIIFMLSVLSKGADDYVLIDESDEVSSAAGCRLPEFPEDGAYRVGGRKSSIPGKVVPPTTIITYLCKEGYEPTYPTDFCRDDGTWIGFSTCNPKSQFMPVVPLILELEDSKSGCSLPQFPEHGTYTVVAYDKTIKPGDTVSPFTLLLYYCQKGYAPSMDSSYCTENSSWSESPVCEAQSKYLDVLDEKIECSGCVLPEFPINGTYAIVGSRRWAQPGTVVAPYTVLNYFCRIGYHPSPVEVVFCKQDKLWFDTPQCKETLVTTNPEQERLKGESGCFLPPFPEGGSYVIVGREDYKITPGEPVLVNTILKYSCQDKLGPTVETTVCLEKVAWSVNPVCKGVLPRFGNLPGNIQEGTETEKIEEKELGCPLPEFPEFGSYMVGGSDNDITPGDIVSPFTILTYSCQEGYAPSAESIYCQDELTWSEISTCIDEKLLPSIVPIDEDGLTSSSGCTLPELPVSGSYSVLGYDGSTLPGQTVPPGTNLQYFCLKGYDLIGVSSLVDCKPDMNWSEIPGCSKSCLIPISPSVAFWRTSSDGQQSAFSGKLPNGVSVMPRCREYHNKLDRTADTNLTCVDGVLDGPLPRCVADCGLNPTNDETSPYEEIFQRNVVPWHVGIYTSPSFHLPKMMLACGGSLITANLVLTAAHCFYVSKLSKTIPTSLISVAVGKVYREWNHPQDDVPYAQTSQVNAIHLPKEYAGIKLNEENDLAVLELTTPFILSNWVHPVCLDIFNLDMNKTLLKTGSFGQVSGWTLPSSSGSKGSLQTITMPVIANCQCKKQNSRFRFGNFLTADKFCAGFLDEKFLCSDDGGSGLVFPINNVDVRWQLRGVASVRVQGKNADTCRPGAYTLFTKVSHLRKWLDELLLKLK